MSQHMAFRRQPVPGQFAQNLKSSTIPMQPFQQAL